MKNRTSVAPARRFDKSLFEAGQQCLKRLYLDYHEPVVEASDEDRQVMSEAGQQLLQLARSAFPRGVEVTGDGIDQVAERTRELLAAETTLVLFGAAFVAADLETTTDIVLRQKNGQLDLYEVKSGTRVKSRYLSDLARQVHTIETAGYRVRAAFVLHVNQNYRYQEGTEHAPDKLFKSADVTERVRRLVPRVAERVREFKSQLKDDSALQLPTGTFCKHPFPCPHLDNCKQQEPHFPLRALPDLVPKLEQTLHEEGIADLAQIDPRRPGLTFRQRRTLQCVQRNEAIVEPFVRDELRHVEYPLHFLAVLEVTDVLPRFDGQRPWRPVPYAFAVETLQENGETARRAFVHADKGDPRQPCVTALAELLARGGMIICWCAEALASVQALLEDLPASKQAVRAVLARPHLDLRQLLEAGVFHPELLGDRDLAATAAVLLGDDSSGSLPVHDDKVAAAAVRRAWAPRVRAATKEKIGSDLQAWLEWRAHALLRLYRRFAELEPPGAGGGPEPAPARRKLPAPE